MSGRIINTLFLVCLFILPTGCGPQFTPPRDPASREPGLRENSFVTFDGTELPLRSWLPEKGLNDTRFIFIAVHGFNDYSNFIKNGALYFNRNRIAVYAYDQRGFGKAPVRGRWSSTETMAEDLQTLVRLTSEKYPYLPIYLLGHSMGGAVVINAMTAKNHPEVAGAILVSPAVWAHSTMPFYQYTALWLAAHTIPWFTVTGESLQRTACNNQAVLKELGRDPLVIKETRFDTIYGLQDLMDKAYVNASSFRINTMVLYGLHDEIIPRKPVIETFDHIPLEPEKQKKLILYDEGYHMLLRDLQAESVMQDIVDWVENGGQGISTGNEQYSARGNFKNQDGTARGLSSSKP